MDRTLEQIMIFAILLDALLEHFKQSYRRDIEAWHLAMAELIRDRRQQMRLADAILTKKCQRSLRLLGKRAGCLERLWLPLLLKGLKGFLDQRQICPLPTHPGVYLLLLALPQHGVPGARGVPFGLMFLTGTGLADVVTRSLA